MKAQRCPLRGQSAPSVIASREAAKQSRENAPRLDCFTIGKLPRVRNDDARHRGCPPSGD
ncbi:MAG: hypothetical protein LBT00_01355 [Spirochaetaceae bacterium]|nr:hypothetical protein [Spirochaetaceae bacterium]